MAPLVADALIGLEHREADASTSQLVCGGEAGLAPADYHCLQLLNGTHIVHLSINALNAALLHSVW
jgi:hypothetical protein